MDRPIPIDNTQHENITKRLVRPEDLERFGFRLAPPPIDQVTHELKESKTELGKFLRGETSWGKRETEPDVERWKTSREREDENMCSQTETGGYGKRGRG